MHTRRTRHLNENVFEGRVGHAPVPDAHALTRSLHLGEYLLGRDAADGDAATQGVANKRVCNRA